jgi:DNA repair protein RadA/Sms
MPKDKTKSMFVCQSCGANFPRWLGKCPECGSWSSLVEEKVFQPKKGRQHKKSLLTPPISLSQIDAQEEFRILSGNKEFDRAMGGGLVSGSVILVGGEPGIGKSTLLLQICEKLTYKLGKSLYLTGEESLKQIKLRANRLKISSDKIEVLTETNVDSILAALENVNPALVVIDSIQTSYSEDLESTPGSISQIRECASQFINFAKENGSIFFLIGHVTKDGFIAGPKVLEHMVDTVVYFEGEKNHPYRILRTAKNRFGSTNEIGIFQMQENGLVEVSNPSFLFLAERAENVSGSMVVCSLEGTRPLLLEVQALVSPTNYGIPQRVCSGIDSKRLALLLAIIEKRVGIRLGASDVFFNVAGGVKVDEPAVDLGVIIAIISSFKDIPANPNTVIIGEVGLGGEVRGVNQIEKRIKEAEKLGFKRVIIPENNLKNLSEKFKLEVKGVKKVAETAKLIFQ